MVRRRPPRGIGVGLAAAFALAACDRGAAPDRPPEPGDVAVARVQGETLWASDVEREAVIQGLISEGEPLDAASEDFRRLLDQVIDQKLLAREAEARKLDDDPAVQRRLAAARDQVLGDVLVERTVDGAVTEEEVQRLYAEYRRGETETETVRVRQIIVADEAAAQAVRRELAGGAAFETLALERSTDAETRFEGGDLGFIDPTLTSEATAAALRGAEPGALIGPTPVDGGFAVYRVEERRREPVRTLEQMRPQIVRFLSFDRIRALLQTIKTDAQVTILTGRAEGAPAAQEPASAAGRPRPAVRTEGADR